MQNTIYLLEGTYRNKLIENPTIQTTKPITPSHKEGGYITVKIVDPKRLCYGATSDKIKVNVVSENPIERSRPNNQRRKRYGNCGENEKKIQHLDSMTKACKKGDVRAMIVRDPRCW